MSGCDSCWPWVLCSACTFIVSVVALCSTRALLLNLNQPTTQHIRKCSYKYNTEKLLCCGRQRDVNNLSVSCCYFKRTHSRWHTVIERWRQTVLPEKMIIHKWIQWEEVLRNKRHFYDFSAVMLWDLNAVKIGIHPQVNPVWVEKRHRELWQNLQKQILRKVEWRCKVKNVGAAVSCITMF